MAEKSIAKIIVGAFILIFCGSFIVFFGIAFLLSNMRSYVPSIEMILGLSAYALFIIFLGRWVSKTASFTSIYVFASGVIPGAVIVWWGWPMLEKGLGNYQSDGKDKSDLA